MAIGGMEREDRQAQVEWAALRQSPLINTGNTALLPGYHSLTYQHGR